MSTKATRSTPAFPCECGKTFPTAEKFSNHVHSDHEDEMSFIPTEDYNERKG